METIEMTSSQFIQRMDELLAMKHEIRMLTETVKQELQMMTETLIDVGENQLKISLLITEMIKLIAFDSADSGGEGK